MSQESVPLPDWLKLSPEPSPEAVDAEEHLRRIDPAMARRYREWLDDLEKRIREEDENYPDESGEEADA